MHYAKLPIAMEPRSGLVLNGTMRLRFFACADEQATNLLASVAEHGWTATRVFIDRPTTRKGHDRRPGQTALMEAIRLGSVERVLLCSIDRVGRTLVELVCFVEMC